MSADGRGSYRRYRRRILGWGAVVLAIVFAIGALVSVTRVEDDLEGRVVAVLDEAGIAGVRVSFSGQDGELTCESPLPDPTVVVDDAEDLRGVRSIELDDSCTGSEPLEEASTPDAGTSELDAPDQTVLEIVATDPQFSALDQAITTAGLRALAEPGVEYTAFAPSNEAFGALTPQQSGALNADPGLLSAILQNHVLASPVLLADLDDGPIDMLGGDQVDVATSADGVVTLTSAGTTATVVDGDIVTTDGVLHVVDRLLFPDDLDLAAAGSPTGTTEPPGTASPTGTTEPPGTTSGAEALQRDLDRIVTDARIGFAAGSTDVSVFAAPVLDEVAAAIVAHPGPQVTVEGHTDSGGTHLANLLISTARAEAVRDALIERGVPEARLEAIGAGASDPVVVDGVEDPVASRRVLFLVQT